MFKEKIEKFDQIITIEDEFKINSFLDILVAESKDEMVRKLNSIFICHMFSRTENPSDSNISKAYINSIHHTAEILMELSKKIQEKTESVDFGVKMENLIRLINAEKFDFEDLEAWKMSARMELIFQQHRQSLSERFAEIRIQLQLRIEQNESINGRIKNTHDIDTCIKYYANEIITAEHSSIDALEEYDLDHKYKNRLKQLLERQIKNGLDDLKTELKGNLEHYQIEIELETGKFSKHQLKKRIIEQIENEEAIENIVETDLTKQFNNFWNKILESEELEEYRKKLEERCNSHSFTYKKYLQAGFENCFEIEQYDISTKQEFETVNSIENWQFTIEQFEEIQIHQDSKYFKQSWWPFKASFQKRKSYKKMMPSMVKEFRKIIESHQKTRKNFIGFVDSHIFYIIGQKFKKAVKGALQDNEIDETKVTPLFMIHCVAFACYKLLLPQLEQNLKYAEKVKNPVNSINTDRKFFEKLFSLKVQGAKRSKIWKHQLFETIKELVIELNLNSQGSEKTYKIIYDYIHNRGRSKDRKVLKKKILKLF